VIDTNKKGTSPEFRKGAVTGLASTSYDNQAVLPNRGQGCAGKCSEDVTMPRGWNFLGYNLSWEEITNSVTHKMPNLL